MEQFVYIDSLSDNIFVSSPLTIKEALGVAFVLNKTHTAWFNDYVLRRWMLGYESILQVNTIPELKRRVLLPVTGVYSYSEFNTLISRITELAKNYTLAEQERIWKWIQLNKN